MISSWPKAGPYLRRANTLGVVLAVVILFLAVSLLVLQDLAGAGAAGGCGGA